jgi:hypothetical protein
MNVFASVKQIWNLFVHLDFPLSQHREKMKMQDTRYKMQVKHVSDIRYPVSSSYVNLVDSRGFYFESSSMELAQPVSHETTRKETESVFTNYPLPIVTQQLPVVSHKSPTISYRNRDIYSLSGTSDFIAPLFRSYSFKPPSFLSQQTVPEKQRGATASNLQKCDTVLPPYGHLERVVLLNGQAIFSSFESSSMALAQPVSHETTRIETESTFTNYRLPLVTQQPPVVTSKLSAVSYKNRDIYSLSGTSDFIAPIFRSYSFKPASFLSQKAVPNEHLQKGDTVLPPYGHLEREVLPNGPKIFSSFESSSMALAQPVSHETTRIETESTFTNYPLPILIRQPPVVSHTPSAISNKNQDISILSGTSDFIAPIFRSYSFKPASFLSQKAVPNEHLQKGDTVLHPYGHLEREVLPNGPKIFSSFESSSMALAQPVSHEITRKETESPFSNYPLPLVTQQPPVVTYEPSAVSNKNLVTYIPSGTSDFIAPIFRSYSFKPTSFLSQKTVPNERLQKSDTVLPPYGHLEREVLPNGKKIFSSFESSSMVPAQPVSHETTRKETESAFTNYPLPLVTQQPPVVTYEPSAVSNNNLGTYIPHTTSDFINRSSFNISNKKNEQMQLGIKKAPIYHTYPKIEHVTATHTEIIKERVIEKKEDIKTLHATPQLPSIDLNRLTDQVYQMLARKVRIERERRGLLCR